MSCSRTPRLTSPAQLSSRSVTAAVTESKDDDDLTNLELIVAKDQLVRLKGRVAKSLPSLTIPVWQRIPFLQHQLRMGAARTMRSINSAGIPYGPEPSPYYFVKTTRRASEVIKLDWRAVTPTDVHYIFRYWNEISVLASGEGLAAQCVAQCKPTARQGQATANQLTLVVWRIQHILSLHTYASYDRQFAPDWIKELSPERFDADGVVMYEPMVLTASDILPVTLMEARVLHSRHAVARAVHLLIPHYELSAYGHEMLATWRQREQAADAKRNASKLQLAISQSSKQPPDAQGRLLDVDPLEVTLCDDPVEDCSTMKDVIGCASQGATRPVWYQEKGSRYDDLMRHDDD